MKRLLILLFLISLHTVSADVVYEVPLNTFEYDIVADHGYDRIIIHHGANSLGPPGYPELPVLPFNYLLAQDEHLTGITVAEEVWEELPGTYVLYPRQAEQVIDEEIVFTKPDTAAYASSLSYPESVVPVTGSGNVRGYQIAYVGVVPFRYVPKDDMLYSLKRLVLRLHTATGRTAMYPRRQTRLVHSMTERFIAGLVVNKDIVPDQRMHPPTFVEDNNDDIAATELPSLLGAPVDYLIITTDAQCTAYEAYARFKKLEGYNTEVRTLSWVGQNYVGVDNAERIRRFIADAVEQWGVLYVVLGGDVPEMPVRYVRTPAPLPEAPIDIVTDLYFSDLDGNWNADGDERFGEPEDSVDLYPDVFIGRLPTRHGHEVTSYKNKVNAYTHPVFTQRQARALFLTSYLQTPGDAYALAQDLAHHLPSWFDTCFLDEKPLQDFKDSLYAGFGIVTGIAHSDINRITVKRYPREFATNFFFDSLTNERSYALMSVIGCFTNTFQDNCLSKHWLLNPHGGGIAYIGPTTNSEAYVHEQFTYRQFDSLFSMPLALSLGISKIFFIPIAQANNWYRLYEFSINLLGDPALSVWDSVPMEYGAVSVDPDTVSVGYDTVVLVVDPPVPFTVVMYKEGELFYRDSGMGVLELGVRTESVGYVKYTVISDGYVAYTDSVVVEPVGPYCVYEGCRVVDTLGNSDSVVNPGEDVLLYVTLANTGGGVASGVDGRLVCDDTLLAMVVDTASFGDVGSGLTGESMTPFRFVVSGDMPDGYSLDFEFVLTYGGGGNRDSFQVIGAASVLGHFMQECVWVGDTVSIVPFVVNYGHSGADSVVGIVGVVSESLEVVDSVVVFPYVPCNGVVSSGSDAVRLHVVYPGAVLRYLYQVYHQGRVVVDCEVVVDTVGVVYGVRAVGMRRSIVLQWLPVDDAVGYRVYRGLVGGGPYELLNTYCEPVCRFEDEHVVGQKYYYYVRAVDGSMNQGVSSDTVCGRINPSLAIGWPQTVYEDLFSSPNVDDLDVLYPGLEIVVCGKDGGVYAWHSDGTPVKGDGRIFTVPGVEIWSSPACGDVNGDGAVEVVFGTRGAMDNVYVINSQGQCLAGWPQSTGRILGSPVLADIDEDSDLEVFVWTQSADVYAFHHDGQGVYASGGLLKDNPGSGYGTLAVADINGDEWLEIVCCGGSQSDSLFVWDRFGNYAAPFPVFIQPEHGLRYSVVLGDVSGDERPEMSFYADSTEGVYMVDADGVVRWFAGLAEVADVEGSPIIADITGDGRGEVMCGYKRGFMVLDSLGAVINQASDTTHDAKLPIVVDVDTDDEPEIVVGSTDWNLYAYAIQGQQAAGFPILFGNRLESSPAAYDIDNDGLLELMVGSFDYRFYVFDLATNTIEWPRFRYDPYNSGMYKSGYLSVLYDETHRASATFGLQVMPTIFSKNTVIEVYGGEMPALKTLHATTLRIYDVAGRLVKDLTSLIIPYASSSIVWNGEDEHSRQVPSGIYFVRFDTGTSKFTRKAIRVY